MASWHCDSKQGPEDGAPPLLGLQDPGTSGFAPEAWIVSIDEAKFVLAEGIAFQGLPDRICQPPHVSGQGSESSKRQRALDPGSISYLPKEQNQRGNAASATLHCRGFLECIFALLSRSRRIGCAGQEVPICHTRLH